jgi:hypothetical protein
MPQNFWLAATLARAHDPQGKDISSHPIAFDLNQYTSLEDRRFSAGFASNRSRGEPV